MGLQPTELPASPITSMKASFFNKRKHDPLDVLAGVSDAKKVRIEVEVTKTEDSMPPSPSPSPSPPHSPTSETTTMELREKAPANSNSNKPLVVGLRLTPT